MDKNAGRRAARAAGICLKIAAGRTCHRTLKNGRCPKHREDIYTAVRWPKQEGNS
jgi:hypothetical protein